MTQTSMISNQPSNVTAGLHPTSLSLTLSTSEESAGGTIHPDVLLLPAHSLLAHLQQISLTELAAHGFSGTMPEEPAMTLHHLGQSAVASVLITSHQNSPSVFAQDSLAATPSASTTFSAVRRTDAEADVEPLACFVCMDAAADAVLIECGHGGLCVGALSTLRSAEFPHISS
jgi:hypothetical protein